MFMCTSRNCGLISVLPKPPIVWALDRLKRRRLDVRLKRLKTGPVVLSHAADHVAIERETGFEPATSTLARLHSTTELLPRGSSPFLAGVGGGVKRWRRL